MGLDNCFPGRDLVSNSGRDRPFKLNFNSNLFELVDVIALAVVHYIGGLDP